MRNRVANFIVLMPVITFALPVQDIMSRGGYGLMACRVLALVRRNIYHNDFG